MSKKKSRPSSPKPTPDVNNRIESLFADLEHESAEVIHPARVEPEPRVEPRSESGVETRKPTETGDGLDKLDQRSTRVEPRSESGVETREPVEPRKPAAPPAPRRGPSSPVYGFLAEAEAIRPASSVLTQAGRESIDQGRLVMRHATSTDPAVLALTLPLSEPGAAGLPQAGIESNLLLEILADQPDRLWSDDERILVEQVADQLSLAIENARLFEQTRARAEELGILREVSLELAQEQLAINSVLEIITRRAMELMDSDGGGVWLHRSEEHQLELVITYQPEGAALAGTRLTTGEGLSGQAFTRRKTCIVNDYPAWSGRSQAFSAAPFHAAMATPLTWQNETVGVLVLTRSKPGYHYTANEQHLAELLGSQAAAAIQNARLYAEEQNRRQIADTLRQIAQVVSSTLDIHQVSELMLDQLHHLIEYHSASIQLLEGDQRRLIGGRGLDSGPQPAERFPDSPRQLLRPVSADPLIQTVVTSRQPLLLADTHNDPRWEIRPETEHIRSWIAAPMIVSNLVVGLIIVDHIAPSAYNQESASLLNTVAVQVAVAIQNARLFEQTQTALAALEIRERYQKNVAQAVASLTERGVSALPEVLQILGEAARASRAIYFETFEDRFPSYWRLMAEWTSPGLPTSLAQSAQIAVQQPSITTDRLPFWGEKLLLEGRLALLLTDLPAGEREIFTAALGSAGSGATGARSVLALAVPGKSALPGFLTFIQNDWDRSWGDDEIAALQTAASALASTLAREDLFGQVQRNLAEAEQLYLASRRLSTAADLNEVIGAVAEGAPVAEINRAVLIMIENDAAGQPENFIFAANWYSGRGMPPLVPIGTRFPIRHFPTTRLALGQQAYFFDDILTDPAIDPTTRQAFEQQKARSVAILPLWISQQQLGTLMLVGDEPHHFTDREIRPYRSLANQMAFVIENRRLFQQTQASLAETEKLYQASAALNLAADYAEVLTVLRQYSLLGEAATANLSLNLFDRPLQGGSLAAAPSGSTPPSERPQWLIPIARWSAEETYTPTTARYPLANWTTLHELLSPDQPTLIEDPANDPRLDETARSVYLERLHAKSILLAPLNVAGKWIGHLVAVFNETTRVPESDLRRLMSLAGQAAVAIESLRLLQETRQRNEELAALNRIIGAASRSLDMSALLAEVLNQVLDTLEYESGLISILNPASGALQLAVHHGLPANMVTRLETAGMQDTLCHLVYDRGQTVFIPDLSTDNTRDHTSLLQSGFRSYLGVPLEAKGRVLGTLCLFSLAPTGSPASEIEPGELTLILAIGQQIGVAVENAGLFEQTQNALAETAALYQASAELNAAQSYDQILAALRQHTLFRDVDNLLTLALFDRPWEKSQAPSWNIVIARWTTLPKENLSLRYPLRSFASHNLLSPSAATIIEDVASDPRLDEDIRQLYLKRFHAASTIFVPLFVAGQWIGFINGVYGAPTQFNQEEVRRLMALSGQAAVAVQNLHSIDLASQRAQEAQQRSKELALVNRVVAAVSASTDLQTSLDAVAHELGEALSVQTGIALLDEERNVLTLVAAHNLQPDLPSIIGVSLPIEGNLSSQQVIETRETLVIDDPQTSPLTEAIHEISIQRGIQALMIVPLIAGNRVIGTVGLDILEKSRSFSIEDIHLAETVVLQASTAIENARLFEQTQRALAETETLYQASAQINSSQSYADILAALAGHTLLGHSASLTIDVFDRPWQRPNLRRQALAAADLPEWIIVLARLRNPGLTRGSSFEPAGEESPNDRYRLQTLPSLATLLNESEPTLIPDLAVDLRPDPALRAILAAECQARSAIFMPLLVAGQWIGFINGLFEETMDFSPNAVRLLSALSVQAAVAIQNIRLLDESRRRAEQLQTAAEIARDTSSTLALDVLLKRIVNLLLDRFGYYHASIFLLDESGAYALVRESTGEAGEEMKRQAHKLPVGSRSIIGYVTATGQSLVVNDVTQDPIHRPNPLLPLTRAELGIALKIGVRVIGALDVQSTRPNSFTSDEIAVLQVLADQVAVAVDNARSYELSQRAIEDMREVDRLKSQFLANMSHELRTPLNSIIGFSRVILKGIDGPITELQQQDLTAIYNSGQHLLSLINDVLDLSKIEAGKMELSFEDGVNLTDLIASVASTTVGVLKDKNVKLQRNLAPDLPVVRADPLKIRQVLINLLSNAAKFTEEGTITIEARVRPAPGRPANQPASSEVYVAVVDTGQGIAPEDQRKLFQPFSQVDGSLTRKTGGSGLGLSICRYLIEMHGGRIGVVSDVGQGSTFYFTLPVEIPGGAPAQPEPQAEPEPSQPPPPPIPTVLAIDNQIQVIRLYERYLANYGYQVAAVTDSSEALARARELRPVTITLDLAVRGKAAAAPDGWQLLKDLKSDPALADIPVIICSILEKDYSGFGERASKLGAAEYLMKPILEEDLVQAIHRVQAGHADRGETQSSETESPKT